MARQAVIDRSAPREKRQAPEIHSYLEAVRVSRDPNAYVALLGLQSYDTATLHKKVQKGLAFTALLTILRLMALPMQMLAEILLIPPRTLQRRKASGRLEAVESDRLVRLSRLYGRAIELFEGDNRAALRWLSTPLVALGETSPLVMSKTEPGALEVERLITRLEHGVIS